MEHILEGLATFAIVLAFAYHPDIAKQFTPLEAAAIGGVLVGFFSYALDNIKWRFWRGK